MEGKEDEFKKISKSRKVLIGAVQMKTILLVEDDKNLNRGISLKLSKEGYRVLSAYSVEEAAKIFGEEEIHLVICDITLPDGSGLDFGKQVHEKNDAYLVYLTALDQEIDVVNGYDTGADDYITKPFSVTILTSKINALMRRITEKEKGIWLSAGVEVHIKDMQVRKDGVIISLSKTEIQLLMYLMENAGQIVSKENILEKVWGLDGQFVDDNTVTVNISRLKNKLDTKSISNVRGLGYIWTEKVIRQ